MLKGKSDGWSNLSWKSESQKGKRTTILD
jgi:hypothetical protein